MNFRDWLNAQESSPFTRSRLAFGWGLGPDIPLAGIHSRSTSPPWIIEKKVKKQRKTKDELDKIFDNFVVEKAMSPSYELDSRYKKAEKKKKETEEEKEKLSKIKDKKKEDEWEDSEDLSISHNGSSQDGFPHTMSGFPSSKKKVCKKKN